MSKVEILREFSRQITFITIVCTVEDWCVRLLGKAIRLIDLEAEKLNGALDDYLDD